MSLAINGTDGIDFNLDDAKIKLGAGDDLQIYHNGSHSYVQDVGVGALYIDGSSVRFRNYANSETMAEFIGDGEVNLYHNNSKKFETTATGATVTGTCTATAFSGSGASLTNLPASGITQADHWRTNSDVSGNQLTITNLEQVDSYGFGSGSEIGSGMSESSGVFTFPATGIWLIMAQLSVYSDNHSQKNSIQIQYTANNGTLWSTNANMQQGIYDQGSDSYGAVSCSVLIDVTNTSNDKVKFNFGAGQGGETCQGHTVYNHTHFVFIRLGDT